MGAIAEAIVAYAQPLLDQTDGSIDEMNRAMTVAQMCWNLAILPEGEREEILDKFKAALEMTDGEFTEFRQHVVLSMIERHHEMFPGMRSRSKQIPDMIDGILPASVKKYCGVTMERCDGAEISRHIDAVPSPTKKPPKADRYAPCPCGSGRKYKFCCGVRK